MRPLEPGEEVLVSCRPHPVVLARPVAGSVVVTAACVAGFLWWGAAPVWFGLLLGAVLVLRLCWLAGRVVQWRSGLLMVTTLRVVHRSGFLRRTGREVPVGRVEDASYSQGLLGHLLGYGSVTLESAGAAEPAPFTYVRHPEELQHQVHLAAEHARQVAAAPPPGGLPGRW